MIEKKNWPITDNEINSRKLKWNDTYFAGTKTIGMVQKLMGPVKDYVNFWVYIWGFAISMYKKYNNLCAFAVYDNYKFLGIILSYISNTHHRDNKQQMLTTSYFTSDGVKSLLCISCE
jgi:hypothetical protein